MLKVLTSGMKLIGNSVTVGNVVIACYKVLVLLMHEVPEQADHQTEADWEKDVRRTGILPIFFSVLANR